MNTTPRIALAAALLLTVPTADLCAQSTCSGSKSATAAAGQHDLIETARAAGSFGTLAKALEAAGLVETLKGEGPFTVFAPTDAAFAQLPEGRLESLLAPENRDLLVEVLTYHVVPGALPAARVVEVESVTTVEGQRLDVAVEDGGVRIDGAHVETTDILCSNGVIHVIDAVLLPETRTLVEVAAANRSFSTLVAALEAAELKDVLSGEGPFTVLAPTDEAFARLPEGALDDLLKPESRQRLVEVLKQHVVPGRIYADQALAARGVETLLGQYLAFQSEGSAQGGERPRIGGAGLVLTDVEASNGVIHVIDAVLLPE